MFLLLLLSLEFFSSVLSYCSVTGRWPNGDITYFIPVQTDTDKSADKFTTDEEAFIESQMKLWTDTGASLRFVKKTAEADAIVVFKGTESAGGPCRKGPIEQAAGIKCPLNVATKKHNVIHELGHLIGLCHEADCFGLVNQEIFLNSLTLAAACANTGQGPLRTAVKPEGSTCESNGAFDMNSIMLYQKPIDDKTTVLCPKAAAVVPADHKSRNDGSVPSPGDIHRVCEMFPPAGGMGNCVGGTQPAILTSQVAVAFDEHPRMFALILPAIFGVWVISRLCHRSKENSYETLLSEEV